MFNSGGNCCSFVQDDKMIKKMHVDPSKYIYGPRLKTLTYGLVAHFEHRCQVVSIPISCFKGFEPILYLYALYPPSFLPSCP
jgi:hypothetical protein